MTKEELYAMIHKKVGKFVEEKGDSMNQVGWFQSEEYVQELVNELGSDVLEFLKDEAKEPISEDRMVVEKKTSNIKKKSV